MRPLETPNYDGDKLSQTGREMNTTKLLAVLSLVAVSSAQTVVATAQSERPEKPNVVLLLTDDLGLQDVKCYDIDEPSPMETPNIDAFAKKGVMFWQGYSPTPVCSSSRCAILSGNHAARAQKTSILGGAPPTCLLYTSDAADE